MTERTDPMLQAWFDVNPYSHDRKIQKIGLQDLPDEVKTAYYHRHLEDEYMQGLDALGSSNFIEGPFYIREIEVNSHVYLMEAYPSKWQVKRPDWWQMSEY